MGKNRDKTVGKGKVVKMKPAAAKKPGKAHAPKALKAPQVSLTSPHIDLFSTTRHLMESTMSKTKTTIPFDQMTKDANDIAKDYSDAVMKSGAIMMKGCENIMSTMMSLMQTSAEKQSRLLKEAMTSKTINEFAEVQNKIAQASFDDFMSGATKLSEMGVKVMTESSEPVNAQMTRAIQKATEAMAA